MDWRCLKGWNTIDKDRAQRKGFNSAVLPACPPHGQHPFDLLSNYRSPMLWTDFLISDRSGVETIKEINHVIVNHKKCEKEEVI